MRDVPSWIQANTIGIRAVAVAALIVVSGCKSVPPPVKERPRYPNGLTASEVFNLRTKCVELVDKQAQVLGMVGVALTSEVSSHYNPDTNRCYAEVVVTKNFSYNYKEHPIPDNYRSTAVYDAQTKQLLVIADQEGDKSHANDFTNKTESFTSYDQGRARVSQLMQDDEQL
jgi:hypothetical protein